MEFAVNLFFLASIVCFATLALFVPFISIMYKLKIHDPFRKKGRLDRFGEGVSIFDKIKAHKSGTPTGGGILIVFLSILALILIRTLKIYELSYERYFLYIITLIIFGTIGFYDDVKKVFKLKDLALRVRHKILIQLGAGVLVSLWGIKKGLFSVSVPFLNFQVENFYILLIISVLTIVFMSNAFNILDGIDGLSSGSFLISMIAFIIFISNTHNELTELVFVFILMGTTLAYLYFNISPARLFMGDTGAIALGAVLGVLTMTTGIFYLLPIFGLIYIVDALSSIVQWCSLYFRKGKKIFKIAPIHHHFEAIGWEGTKVVFRFWVIHAIFTLLGLGLFFLVV